MKRADVEDIYSLSPTQEGMLFESVRAELVGIYFEQLRCTLSGDLDPALLEASWQRVVDRHPILRTGFFWRGLARPHQVVKRNVRVPWRHLDWRSLDAAERRARTAELLRRDVEEGFDLGKPPLLRFTLVRLDESRSLFVWSFHHLLLDGWSVQLVLGEVLAAYQALAAGRAPRLEPRRPFRDYITWLERQDLAEAEAFWRRELGGVSVPDVLPASGDGGAGPAAADGPAGAVPGGAFGEIELRLSGEGAESLRRTARRHRVTLASFLQGAWAALLCRYAASDEVVFGATVSGRGGDLPGLESMVGMFINTLPMRVRMPARRPLSESLAGLQELAAEMRHFEHTPLVQAHAWSGVPRDQPLFETLFVFENYPAARSDGGRADGGGVGIADMRLVEQPNYPVSLVVAPGPDAIVFRFRHRRARLGDAAARRMLGHFGALLDGVLAAEDPRPAELPLLAAGERHQLLHEWTGASAPWPRDASLAALVAEQAALRPDAVAVEWGQEVLTFGALTSRAAAVAAALADRGVGRGAAVGLAVERSPEMVVGMLAALWAGGAYVPLDPSYPRERLLWMVADSGIAALLADGHRIATPGGNLPVLRLDEPLPAAPGPASEPAAASGDDLAYVIYTSGSTGRPKGVAVPQRAVARLAIETDYVTPGPDRRVGQAANASFDATTFEVWTALLAGGTVVGVDREASLDPAALGRLLAAHRVDSMFLTTSLFNQVARAEPRALSQLDELLVGGEALDPRPVREVLAQEPPRRLLNGYGPTESTTFAVWKPIEHVPREAVSVPIGRPLAHTRAWVLDGELLPVPVGIAGDLWLGGDGLARGYLARPALTAAAFCPDPVSGAPGGRLYATGDRARWRADGEIDFLGRLDDQVKVRGFRIELGEIEAVLDEHPAVEKAVVLAREDGPGERRLVAYVVHAASASGDRLAWMGAWLAERLPAYMVPSAFVALDALPLTANGKLDRDALAAIEPARTVSVGEGRPETPTESILAGLWAELLGAGEVTPDDDFFDLGGHSLLAMRLVSRVRATFETELGPAEVFEHSTLAGLAARIDALSREETGLEVPPLERRDRPAEIPLSFSQERLWFLQQLDPGSAAAFNVPFDMRLDGPLDVAAFAQSVGEVVRRHESLRTRFEAVAGRPVQRIEPAAEVPLPVVDLGGLADADRPRELAALARRRARRGFDLATLPLLSLTLVRLSWSEHAVLAAIHHIVSDGWSRGVLAREVGALYAPFREGRPSPLPELGFQYADFSLWQRGWLRGEALEAELDFWRERFAGAPEGIELPLDRPRPPVRSLRGARRRHALPPGLRSGLAALGARHGATLYMALLAAFAALLHRYSGQRDLLVGSPVANRTEAELEGLVGFFVNTLVLRMDVGGGPSFRELLTRVRRVCLEAYAHRHLPFEQLVEALEPERDLSHNPLFQVLFVFQAAGVPRVEPGELSIRPLSAGQETSMFDLVLSMAEEGERLAVLADFSRDLFDGATVARALRHLETLLAGAVEAPERPLSELPLLSAPEAQQLLREWNGVPAEPPGPRLLHELLSEHVRSRPEAVAVVDGGMHLSYGTLGERAAALARRLAAAGTGPGDLVGVLARRGLEQVVSVAGVLNAGAGFLPLDPDHPPERLRGTLADAGARAVLVGWGLAYDPGPGGPPALRPETAWNGGPPEAGAPCDRVPHPDHPAYAIYTSGSTGRPKGVVVPHRGVVDTLLWRRRRFRVGPADRILATVPPTFDPSVWQTFGALGNGACLVMAPPDAGRDAPGLVRLLAREAITITDFPPSLLDALLDEEGPEGFEAPALRHLFCGGEALPRRLVDRFAGRSTAWLHNVYGPTETSIDASCWTCLPGAAAQAVPIGRPISGKRLHVLDRELRPLPAGVAGGLWIGGTGLSRGYLGRPAETAASFRPDPFAASPGRRLYRSGDVARHRAGGELEFLGRADEQVKIRGFRVELGEVEAALAAHPGVAEATVVLSEGPAVASGAAGDAALIGYVGAPRPVAPEELAGFLRSRLPGYMVPAALVVLDALPRNPNGKVDRSALPPPVWTSSAEHVAPEGPVEEALAAIWKDLLGHERIGREDGFFDLGGHSLLATRVASRVRSELGVELPVRRIFEAPRLRDLAAEVRRLRSFRDAVEEESAPPPLVPVPRDEPLPLSFGQQRLWFLHQLAPESATYHVASAHRIAAEALPALESALAEVVRRHEVLRTAFPAVDGEPVQAIAPPRAPRLPVVDLRELSGAAREREGGRLRRGLAVRPFDLEAAAPVRLALVFDGDVPLLCATLHHVAGDGWSAAILGREVSALLAAFRAGRPSPLPELAVQYADFAHWQRRWLSGAVLDAEVGYWRRRLEGLPPALDLPTDRPRPAVAAPRGARLPVPPAPGLGDAVERLAREREATPFMVLLAAVGALLSRLSGELDLAVGSPVAGRTRTEVEGLIGFFVNTLVLRVELAGRPSFGGLLERVRETALGAYAHQHLPFEKLVEELDPERNLARTPFFQVMLGYDGSGQSAPPPGTASGSSAATPSEGSAAARAGDSSAAAAAAEVGAGKFDLTFSLAARPGGELTGQLSYDAGLFDATTVARWARHLQRLLRAAAETPEVPVAELPLLGAAERHQVACEWSGAPSARSAAVPFPTLVAAWAGRTPDAVAVAHEESRMTYGELARRAAGLARAVTAACGGPDGPEAQVPVAVCLERSPEMIVAILAAQLVGAPYVPLDPEMPAVRRAFCLADSGAAVLVTRRELAPDPAEWRGKSLFVEEAAPGAANGRGAIDSEAERTAPSVVPPAPPDAGARERLAYVVYTSGSTGRPKGVAVSHGQVASYLAAIASRLGEPSAPSFATVSTVAADLGNTGIFLALGRGGTLHVVSEGRVTDGERFAAYFAARPVDGLKIVPSHLAALLSAPEAAAALPRRWLVLGGEAPGRELLARLCSLGVGNSGGCRVLNHYGPTEATVGVAAHRLPVDLATGPGPVPVGRPLAGGRVLVLDPELGAAPAGGAGELGLGGPQVARGYFGRPRETAARFVPSLWGGSPGERLYLSGDRGRFRADGTLEFLGRSDDQVKLRGHRVEPAEVASALAAHAALAEVAVVGRVDPGGETRLVAYLVAASPVSPAALREHLAGRLPEAMIPSLFVFLPSLPLTANGKLDRRALPEPDWGRRGGTAAGEGAVAPRDRVEAELVRLWEELLEVRPIGVRDDFFALGGHSLLAVRLRARVEAAFGREVPLVELLRHPTVETLARWLIHGEAAEGPGALPRGLVPLAADGRGRPLFLVHEAGGSVAGFRPLAARLHGTRPVYGIEADAAPEDGPSGSVEAMAAAYLEAVRELDPDGPWLLGGWSFGGLVAFEMARQLEASGEPVGAVFLLDAPPPGDDDEGARQEPSLPSVLAFFAREAGLAVDREELEEAAPEVAVRRVAEVAVAAGLLPASGAEEYLRHRLDLLGRNRAARTRYRASEPIDALLVYLRPTAEDPPGTAGADDPTRGWGRRSRRPVRLHLLPGDHWSFLAEPEVAEVARLLEEAIEEGTQGNRSSKPEPVLQEG